MLSYCLIFLIYSQGVTLPGWVNPMKPVREDPRIPKVTLEWSFLVSGLRTIGEFALYHLTSAYWLLDTWCRFSPPGNLPNHLPTAQVLNETVSSCSPKSATSSYGNLPLSLLSFPHWQIHFSLSPDGASLGKLPKEKLGSSMPSANHI